MPENRIRAGEWENSPRCRLRRQQAASDQGHEHQRRATCQKRHQAQGVRPVAQYQENGTLDPKKERRGALGKEERAEKLAKTLADGIEDQGRLVMPHGWIACVMKYPQSDSQDDKPSRPEAGLLFLDTLVLPTEKDTKSALD